MNVLAGRTFKLDKPSSWMIILPMEECSTVVVYSASQKCPNVLVFLSLSIISDVNLIT
jgi:hypothetical protein